jgi:hypothetical protein
MGAGTGAACGVGPDARLVDGIEIEPSTSAGRVAVSSRLLASRVSFVLLRSGPEAFDWNPAEESTAGSAGIAILIPLSAILLS